MTVILYLAKSRKSEMPLQVIGFSTAWKVAREGIEPLTPAFSERNFRVFSTTYKVREGCLNTWKYVMDGQRTGGDNG